MKYFIPFIVGMVILVHPNYLTCQPGFNELLDAGYDMNHFRDMIVVNDTIIGYGIGFDNPTNGQQGMVLVKLDSSGNILQSKLLIDSIGDKFNIGKHWGNIIPTEDGGFAMTAAVVGRNSAFLIKTDRDFEVEFIKEYYDSISAANFQYEVIRARQGYLLHGMIQDENLIFRQFARLVDEKGEIIWDKRYGNPNSHGVLTEGRPINDSTFILASYEMVTPDLSGPTRTVLRKINIDGEVIDSYQSGVDPPIGQITKILVLDDGSFIFHGVSIVDWVGQNEIVKVTLTKMDSDFNIEWIRRYGIGGTYIAQRWFRELAPTLDGHFIAAGESFINVGGTDEPSGWLMKFNIEGDSIWSRYDFPDFPMDSLGDTYFGGVGVLSSGSIVAGGAATLWNKRVIWLVKVTADGCIEVINCGLVPTLPEPEPAETFSLHLSPNPTNGQVKAAWAATDKAATLWLYNLQGQLMEKRVVGRGEGEADFEVGHLPSGIYFMEVRDGAGRFGREKLVVLD